VYPGLTPIIRIQLSKKEKSEAVVVVQVLIFFKKPKNAQPRQALAV